MDYAYVSLTQFKVDYKRGGYIFASNRTAQMTTTIEVNRYNDQQIEQIITDYEAGTEYYINLSTGNCEYFKQDPQPFPEQCISDRVWYKGPSYVGSGDDQIAIDKWIGWNDNYEEESSFTKDSCTPLSTVGFGYHPLRSYLLFTQPLIA